MNANRHLVNQVIQTIRLCRALVGGAGSGMDGGGVGRGMFGGGAGRGMSGGGAGGGRPIAGMLFRCIRCFAGAGACNEASCLRAPALGLECSTLVAGGDFRPVPGTNDGVDEMAIEGRIEARKGAGLERTCTDVGLRSV